MAMKENRDRLDIDQSRELKYRIWSKSYSHVRKRSVGELRPNVGVSLPS